MTDSTNRNKLESSLDSINESYEAITYPALEAAFNVKSTRNSLIRKKRNGASKRLGLLQDFTLDRIFFISLWLASQAAIIFAVVFKSLQKKTALQKFANATSHCIMFDTSVILLLMSPTLISVLRHTFVSHLVVVDKNVHAHKIAGYSVALWSLLHVACYCKIFNNSAKENNVTLFKQIVSDMMGRAGLALTILFPIIILTSVPIVRKKFHEFFYYTHQLFIALIILMFVHRKDAQFYKYIIFPGTVYTIDRVYRFIRGFWGTPKVLTVIQHSQNVVEIHIEKRRMNPTPGQFVYIMCPSIDPIQWHPFTLTSSPQENFISLHISGMGNWTRSLMLKLGCELNSKPEATDELIKKIELPQPTAQLHGTATSQFQKLMLEEMNAKSEDPLPSNDTVFYMNPVTRQISQRPRGNTDSRVLHQDFNVYDLEQQKIGEGSIHTPSILSKPLPKIFIDGPYGAPTEMVFDYSVSILIGAGIGVTPFTSILKYLNYCHTQSYRPGKLKKVYFIWVCREIKSLEWFMDVLIALDKTNMKDYLEIRVYLTENIGVDNIHNLSINHDPHGRDSITNLKNCVTYFGRPNFDTIFGFIDKKHSGSRTGVFFCGSKAMGKSIRRQLNYSNSRMRKTNKTSFVFHKENF